MSSDSSSDDGVIRIGLSGGGPTHFDPNDGGVVLYADDSSDDSDFDNLGPLQAPPPTEDLAGDICRICASKVPLHLQSAHEVSHYGQIEVLKLQYAEFHRGGSEAERFCPKCDLPLVPVLAAFHTCDPSQYFKFESFEAFKVALLAETEDVVVGLRKGEMKRDSDNTTTNEPFAASNVNDPFNLDPSEVSDDDGGSSTLSDFPDTGCANPFAVERQEVPFAVSIPGPPPPQQGPMFRVWWLGVVVFLCAIFFAAAWVIRPFVVPCDDVSTCPALNTNITSPPTCGDGDIIEGCNWTATLQAIFTSQNSTTNNNTVPYSLCSDVVDSALYPKIPRTNCKGNYFALYDDEACGQQVTNARTRLLPNTTTQVVCRCKILPGCGALTGCHLKSGALCLAVATVGHDDDLSTRRQTRGRGNPHRVADAPIAVAAATDPRGETKHQLVGSDGGQSDMCTVGHHPVRGETTLICAGCYGEEIGTCCYKSGVCGFSTCVSNGLGAELLVCSPDSSDPRCKDITCTPKDASGPGFGRYGFVSPTGDPLVGSEPGRALMRNTTEQLFEGHVCVADGVSPEFEICQRNWCEGNSTPWRVQIPDPVYPDLFYHECREALSSCPIEHHLVGNGPVLPASCVPYGLLDKCSAFFPRGLNVQPIVGGAPPGCCQDHGHGLCTGATCEANLMKPLPVLGPEEYFCSPQHQQDNAKEVSLGFLVRRRDLQANETDFTHYPCLIPTRAVFVKRTVGSQRDVVLSMNFTACFSNVTTDQLFCPANMEPTIDTLLTLVEEPSPGFGCQEPPQCRYNFGTCDRVCQQQLDNSSCCLDSGACDHESCEANNLGPGRVCNASWTVLTSATTSLSCSDVFYCRPFKSTSCASGAACSGLLEQKETFGKTVSALIGGPSIRDLVLTVQQLRGTTCLVDNPTAILPITDQERWVARSTSGRGIIATLPKEEACLNASRFCPETHFVPPAPGAVSLAALLARSLRVPLSEHSPLNSVVGNDVQCLPMRTECHEEEELADAGPSWDRMCVPRHRGPCPLRNSSGCCASDGICVKATTCARRPEVSPGTFIDIVDGLPRFSFTELESGDDFSATCVPNVDRCPSLLRARYLVAAFLSFFIEWQNDYTGCDGWLRVDTPNATRINRTYGGSACIVDKFEFAIDAPPPSVNVCQAPVCDRRYQQLVHQRGVYRCQDRPRCHQDQMQGTGCCLSMPSGQLLKADDKVLSGSPLTDPTWSAIMSLYGQCLEGSCETNILGLTLSALTFNISSMPPLSGCILLNPLCRENCPGVLLCDPGIDCWDDKFDATRPDGSEYEQFTEASLYGQRHLGRRCFVSNPFDPKFQTSVLNRRTRISRAEFSVCGDTPLCSLGHYAKATSWGFVTCDEHSACTNGKGMSRPKLAGSSYHDADCTECFSLSVSRTHSHSLTDTESLTHTLTTTATFTPPPTPTSSLSVTVSASVSPSSTVSSTTSVTTTSTTSFSTSMSLSEKTDSLDETASETISGTASLTFSHTERISESDTLTDGTESSSVTVTPSDSGRTPSYTQTLSGTPTLTVSPTLSDSTSLTNTLTRSVGTPTPSSTYSPSPSASSTETLSSSSTPSVSATKSATRSATESATVSATASASFTTTASETIPGTTSISLQLSTSDSETVTDTDTVSVSATDSQPPTDTESLSTSSTDSLQITLTQTITGTHSASETAASTTVTVTPPDTTTPSQSQTLSRTDSRTAGTPSSSASVSPSRSPTLSETVSVRSFSGTSSQSVSETLTGTASHTASVQTQSASESSSPTFSHSESVTGSPTLTPPPTASPSLTVSTTETVTRTPEPTVTQTATNTHPETGTATRTATITDQPTASASASHTITTPPTQTMPPSGTESKSGETGTVTGPTSTDSGVSTPSGERTNSESLSSTNETPSVSSTQSSTKSRNTITGSTEPTVSAPVSGSWSLTDNSESQTKTTTESVSLSEDSESQSSSLSDESPSQSPFTPSPTHSSTPTVSTTVTPPDSDTISHTNSLSGSSSAPQTNTPTITDNTESLSTTESKSTSHGSLSRSLTVTPVATPTWTASPSGTGSLSESRVPKCRTRNTGSDVVHVVSFSLNKWILMPTPTELVDQAGTNFGPLQVYDPEMIATPSDWEIEWHDPKKGNGTTWQYPTQQLYATGIHAIIFTARKKYSLEWLCGGVLQLNVGQFIASWQLKPMDQSATNINRLKTEKETEKLVQRAKSYFEWRAGCELELGWMTWQWIHLGLVEINGMEINLNTNYLDVQIETPIQNEPGFTPVPVASRKFALQASRSPGSWWRVDGDNEAARRYSSSSFSASPVAVQVLRLFEIKHTRTREHRNVTVRLSAETPFPRNISRDWMNDVAPMLEKSERERYIGARADRKVRRKFAHLKERGDEVSSVLLPAPTRALPPSFGGESEQGAYEEKDKI